MVKKSRDITMFLITAGCLLFGLFGNVTAAAQDFVVTRTNKGNFDESNFDFYLALYADAFRYDVNTFGYEELRASKVDKNTKAVSMPFSNFDWLSGDSRMDMGFQKDWFGGRFSLKTEDVIGFRVLKGTVQGWVKFGRPDMYLKILAGNANEFTYVDPQGADPGPRVYIGNSGDTWKDSKNPDNITQDDGIALSGFWKGLTLDLAAGQYTVVPVKVDPQVDEYGDYEKIKAQYGARLGYEIEGLGKINASYIINYEKGERGTYIWDTSGNLVASNSQAELFQHSYGIYASLSPIDKFGVTVGYSGYVTKYLDDYWTSIGDNKMETTFPLIWRHAVNLNAKYVGLLDGALRLRTDHNMTYYRDKDYLVFDVRGSSSGWNNDYNPIATGKDYAEVEHFFLWNGLGVEYDVLKFSDDRKLMLKLYARNLFRQDLAATGIEKGTTSGTQIKEEFRYTRDEIFADFQVMYFFSDHVQVFGGLRFENLLTSRGQGLNGQTDGLFLDSMTMPQDALPTNDSKLAISIPVGMILSW